MTNCNDPFVATLNEKGYHLVAYPKTSIKPLHVYQSVEERKFIRLFVKSDVKNTSGFLKEMFKNHSGEIGIEYGEGIGIDTITSQKVKSEVSAKILTNYLNTLLPQEKRMEENQVKALFANTEHVVFKIDEIKTIDANEIALRNWLNDNQNELRDIYKTDIESGTLYLATSLLKSSKVTLTCERSSTASIAADLANAFNLPLSEGNIKYEQESSNSDKIIYTGTEGIIFGVKLVRLKFSPKGILTIDNRQDFNRVLGENIDADFYKTNEGLVDIE